MPPDRASHAGPTHGVLGDDCLNLCKADAKHYDAIQVRDKVFAGLVGLACARWRRSPIFFWMSFPVSEGFIDLARRGKLSLGLVRTGCSSRSKAISESI